MKTKIFLAAVLFFGINAVSFSQEEITIKQVLRNSSTDAIQGTKDKISYVRINTSIPVTINNGEQNTIYLTGKFSSEDDYSGFCTLEEGILYVNSPKKGTNITLELVDNVSMYYFGNNASVLVNKDINVEKFGIIGIENNSIATINSNIKGDDLSIRSRNNSKISFYSIDVDKLDTQIEKGSEIILNGKANTLNIDKDESSKFINNKFYYSDLTEAIKPKGGDTVLAQGEVLYKLKRSPFDIEKDSAGNIITSTGDTSSKDELEYNSFTVLRSSEKANVLIGKNTKVNISFLDRSLIGEDYVSNYPIKGYEKGQLVVQDDYPLDLDLTIRKDIGDITIMDGAEVNIISKINEKERSYCLFKDAKLNFNQETKIEDLLLKMDNGSKVSFKDLKADKVSLQGDGTSDLEINGEVGILDRYKYDDINLKGDYKIDSIKERKIKTLTIGTHIPFKTDKTNKTEAEEAKSEKIKAQDLGRDKMSFALALSYGILNWSDRVTKIDDLFSSPTNEYDLKWGNSWNFGIKYGYKPNKKLSLLLGIGMEFNIFKFQNKVMMTDINGEKRLAYETNPSINPESNLNAYYVTIPLHFQYFFYKDFSVHAGGVFGINFRNSSTGFQREYNIPNVEITEEWGTNYNNFKPIKLEVQAGIGWSTMNLYVKYALTPLFKDNREREVYPFSVGLSLGI